MAAFNEHRFGETQVVNIAQVDSIIDQIQHVTLEEHPIDAFLIAQANEERDNPPIQLEDSDSDDDSSSDGEEMTEEERRARYNILDHLYGYNSIHGEPRKEANRKRADDIARWNAWIEKRWFKQTIDNILACTHRFDGYKSMRQFSHWGYGYLHNRYDPDLLKRDELLKIATEKHKEEKAFRKAAEEAQIAEENAQIKCFREYIFKNVPHEGKVSITFKFTGFKTKKPQTKTVEIDKNDLEFWYESVPVFRDLFISLIYYPSTIHFDNENERKSDQEMRSQFGFDFFPLELHIDPELPVLPKAIDAYVHFINTGIFHDDTHLLTATVAEALGDFDFGKWMMEATDPMMYTVDSMQFFTPSMEETFIRSYLDMCFKCNLSGQSWRIRTYHYRRNKIRAKYGMDPTIQIDLDLSTGGFRIRLRTFFEKKPDIAQYIFENQRKVMETYFRIPNRQVKRYSQVKTFDDLIAFVNEADSIATSKSAGGSEVVRLAREDPHIKKLYAQFNELVNRNCRHDYADEIAAEGGMHPQEREDALREQIAQAEKRFIAKYNSTRTQKVVKDHVVAAKAACSSKRGKR
jgi:hypothetical protein